MDQAPYLIDETFADEEAKEFKEAIINFLK
jgi:hypothetical protein